MQESECSERTAAAPQAQETVAEVPASASDRSQQPEGGQEATGASGAAPGADAQPQRQEKTGPDWLAVEVLTVVGLLFAIIARLNVQPSTALVPVAALAAPGCGLLVTAIRKLRTLQRPGLLEAALSGAILALCHLGAALTYPSVLSTLLTQAELRLAFLSTWGLVIIFALALSVVGAALGHLAFAPLRPLPARSQSPTKERRSQVFAQTEEEESSEEEEEAASEEAALAVSLRTDQGKRDAPAQEMASAASEKTEAAAQIINEESRGTKQRESRRKRQRRPRKLARRWRIQGRHAVRC